MKIEKLVTTPDRSGRYRVEFHDGTVMRLYRQTVEDYGLYSGKEFTEEEFSKFQNDASALSAKMRAVRIVSASGVSKRELEHRLVQKGEDPDQAKAAVEWMSELSLIDDQKTAEQIVSRCISKGYGISRAKQALYEKRVPKELWEDALENYPDQLEKILDFLQSKLTADSQEKEIRRVIDALLRRGHSYSSIRKALNQLSFDTEDLPEA